MKRLVWFTAGAAAGVSGSAYARRKLRQAAERYRPVNVARGAAGQVRSRGRDLVDAVREGRAAMAAKEAELRERQRGPAPIPATILATPPAEVPAVHVIVVEAERQRTGVPGPRRRARR